MITLNPKVIGGTLILWGIFSFQMWISAISQNIALNLLFLTLVITFFLLGAGEIHDNKSLIKAGGIIGIICAIIAFYTSFAILTN